MKINFKAASLFSPAQDIQTILAVFLVVAMAIIISMVLGFEYIGGYMPCDLCYAERIPYYIGIVVMLIATILSLKVISGIIIRSFFIITALFMIYNLGLSIYHAGAEYEFWAGPSSCSSGNMRIVENASDLINSLSNIIPPSCDRAAVHFLGLSFAGWNVVATFILTIISLGGAFIGRDK